MVLNGRFPEWCPLPGDVNVSSVGVFVMLRTLSGFGVLLNKRLSGCAGHPAMRSEPSGTRPLRLSRGPRASFPTASDSASRLRSLLVRNCPIEALIRELSRVLLVRACLTVNVLMAFSLRCLGVDTGPSVHQDGLERRAGARPRRATSADLQVGSPIGVSSTRETCYVSKVQEVFRAEVPFAYRWLHQLDNACM